MAMSAAFFKTSNISTLLPILIMLMIAGLVLTGCQSTSAAHHPSAEQENQAKEHLNQLLGQEESPAGKKYPTPSQKSVDPLAAIENAMPWGNIMPGQTHVAIEEQVKEYQVKIGLSNAQDLESVKLNVTPHRIEVSGQTSYGNGENGFQGSSSFFKSFSTSAELVPNQVKRQQSEQAITYVIPKRHPSQPQDPQQQNRQPMQSQAPESNPAHNETEIISPDILQQIESSPGRSI